MDSMELFKCSVYEIVHLELSGKKALLNMHWAYFKISISPHYLLIFRAFPVHLQTAGLLSRFDMELAVAPMGWLIGELFIYEIENQGLLY